MAYEIVMGLEVHVELSTSTKIFCGCSTEFGSEPNSHVCPTCLGMPGTLPVLNKEVVEKALRAGLALNCEIQTNNMFDRKNYFYPDLPKNYQLSQLYQPICRDGYVEIDTGGEVGGFDTDDKTGEQKADTKKKIRIHEIHMEEDAGKLIHDASGSMIDYNRGGVPLIEIVSEPDLRSTEEVIAYLEKLQEILVYLGVSDCKMQEGSMRADVNLSVRLEDETEYGIRTETKNMNSFKAIARAIEYESQRQIALVKSGGTVKQETRRWDDDKGENYAMRSKENAQDYRYFPDPDLVPVFIDEAWKEKAIAEMPELASQKRERYKNDYNIPDDQAKILTSSKGLAELFDKVASATKTSAPLAANLIVSDILKLVKEAGSKAGGTKASDTKAGGDLETTGGTKAGGGTKDVSTKASGPKTAGDLENLSVDPQKIADVAELIDNGKITRNVGRKVLVEVYNNDVDPQKYVKENGLIIEEDLDALSEIVEDVLANNPNSIADYKGGKEQAFGYLVGQVMREVKGKASPQSVNKMLKEKLEKVGVEVKLSERALDKNAKKGKVASEQNSDEKSEKGQDDKSEQRQKQKTSRWKEQLGKEEEQKEIQVQESQRYRSVTCGDLRDADIGKDVKVAGWINTIRDHGGVAFIDVRDQYGVTQVVVSEEQLKDLHKEMVVSISGKVYKRDDETINPNLDTGQVELKEVEIEILGHSHASLPFEIDTSRDTREDLRLEYRYLDLRNPKVHDNIVFRAEITKHIRKEMEAMGFLEIQTPILANSSPEGARDYLVPSRKYKGKFYALPQAPQQFKQLLMVSGFDKYFQIAPCFRDEDARLDRSPGEFYQLDFEMAFATQEDVFAVAEQVLSSTFKRFGNKEVSPTPFKRIPFEVAMLKYGTDKPDLRNPLEIIDLTDFFAKVDFEPFKGNMVRGIVVPDAVKMSKKFFKEMEKYALGIGMGGLGYISVLPDMTYKGPIDKFFTDEQKKEVAEIANLKPDDVLYFISDEPNLAPKYAGEIRTEVAKRLDLIDTNKFEFCYITDFPMYEINEDTGQIDFTHNPFSMPQGEMEALLEKDPLDIYAYQYDIVCNGVELSSGAVRNHRPDVMLKAFEIAGYSEKDVEEKFGALYNAFQYGAPPHAGMAPGIDRIIMLLSGEENIREVIAFPLNSNAQNLMLDAPSEVTEQQLRDVHIKIRD